MRSVLTGQVPFDKSEWKELVGLHDSYIDLGTNKLEWSTGGTSGGYLYSWDVRRPWNQVWEFAPCSKVDLSEVEAQDADCNFYHFDSPNRWEVFGWRMKTNSLAVNEGHLVLVRHIGNTNVAYAVQIEEQDMKGARISVKTLVKEFAR